MIEVAGSFRPAKSVDALEQFRLELDRAGGGIGVQLGDRLRELMHLPVPSRRHFKAF